MTILITENHRPHSRQLSRHDVDFHGGSDTVCTFSDIANDLNVSLTRASYLTSLQIAILGGAPVFWRPLSDRYGRRPIFLLSLICSAITNIGCANSPTYATMGFCRALTAFFISPAGAIGAAVVVELFFKNERARYMGVWTLMLTLGVPIAPFIFGFVAQRVGYRWIYYILAIVGLHCTIRGLDTRPRFDYFRRRTTCSFSCMPYSATKQCTFERNSRAPHRANRHYFPSDASTRDH